MIAASDSASTLTVAIKVAPKGSRILGKWIRLLFGVALLAMLLAVVHVQIGWEKLLSPWLTIPPLSLIGAAALTVVSYALRAFRVHNYFLPATKGGFLACLRLTLLHNLLNILLPMRSGEASFPVLMRRYFLMPMTQSVAGLLWFRVMDLHVLVAIGLSVIGTWWLPAWLVVGLSLAWLSFAWLLFRLQNGSRLTAISDRLPAHWRPRVSQFKAGLPQTRDAFARAWVSTLVNWIVKLAAFGWILQLFSPMPPAAALIGALGGDLTSVLPFHGFAGAGTYEAGVVSALVPFGVATGVALMAAVNLHLFVLGLSLAAGAIAMLYPGQVRATSTLGTQ